MFGFLLALIVIVGVLLVLIILLQSGKGGGLASTFGGASSSTDSLMGGRQAANLLTRMTWIGGGLFLFLAIVLSVITSRTSLTRPSILRSEFGTQPAPTSLLDSEDATPLLIPGSETLDSGAVGAPEEGSTPQE